MGRNVPMLSFQREQQIPARVVSGKGGHEWRALHPNVTLTETSFRTKEAELLWSPCLQRSQGNAATWDKCWDLRSQGNAKTPPTDEPLKHTPHSSATERAVRSQSKHHPTAFSTLITHLIPSLGNYFSKAWVEKRTQEREVSVEG